MSYVMEVEMMKQIHQMNMPSPTELNIYKQEIDVEKIIDDLIKKCNDDPSTMNIKELRIF